MYIRVHHTENVMQNATCISGTLVIIITRLAAVHTTLQAMKVWTGNVLSRSCPSTSPVANLSCGTRPVQ